MTDPIHAEDGSPLQAPAKEERPFVHPMSAHGTPPGSEESEDTVIDPRMAMIEEMADKNNAERMPEDGTVLNGLVPEFPEGYDPDNNVVVEAIVEEGQDTEEVQQVAEEVQQVAEESELPDEYLDNPLAQYIVMDGETPMFKTTYQGTETLIPLENAQREIQKHVAADIRLQQNTERQRELDAREVQLEQQSVALTASLEAQHNSPPSPPVADVDDAALELQAREVVSGLFTGSEEEAAAKLADLLKASRGPTQAPQVDADQIVQRAVQATRQQLSQEAQNADVNSGYKQFTNDYPEILADANLYGYADSMTDGIAKDNPDWLPSAVMLEAGKRVREWVQSMKTPEQSAQPTNNDRLERKQQLRPLPRIRQGTQTVAQEEKAQTPKEMMDEIRASRGQVA